MYVLQQTLPLRVQLLLPVHISVAVDMRTLLDRKNFSSSADGQVAAHRVTVYYQKALVIGVLVKLTTPYAFMIYHSADGSISR